MNGKRAVTSFQVDVCTDAFQRRIGRNITGQIAVPNVVKPIGHKFLDKRVTGKVIQIRHKLWVRRQNGFPVHRAVVHTFDSGAVLHSQHACVVEHEQRENTGPVIDAVEKGRFPFWITLRTGFQQLFFLRNHMKRVIGVPDKQEIRIFFSDKRIILIRVNPQAEIPNIERFPLSVKRICFAAHLRVRCQQISTAKHGVPILRVLL